MYVCTYCTGSCARLSGPTPSYSSAATRHWMLQASDSAAQLRMDSFKHCMTKESFHATCVAVHSSTPLAVTGEAMCLCLLITLATARVPDTCLWPGPHYCRICELLIIIATHAMHVGMERSVPVSAAAQQTPAIRRSARVRVVPSVSGSTPAQRRAQLPHAILAAQVVAFACAVCMCACGARRALSHCQSRPQL